MMKETFQKKWLIANILLLILLGVGVYFALGALKKSQQVYQSKVNETQQFVSGKIYPNEENLDAKQADVEKLKQLQQLLERDFADYTGAKQAKPDNFDEFFTRTINQTKKTLNEAGVIYDSALLFGFEDYANQSIKTELQEELGFSLAAICDFIQQVADNGVKEVVTVTRKKTNSELGIPVNKRDKKFFKCYEFEVLLKGGEAGIQTVLNNLLRDHTYFTVLKSYRIQSSVQQPLKLQEVSTSTPNADNIDSILNGTDAEEVPQTLVTQVSGDADLHLALQLEILKP